MSSARAAVALFALAALLLAAPARPLTPEQQRARLALDTQQFEEVLAQSGELLDDPPLQAYLQGVLEQLFPDLEGKLRVHVLRDASFNAFAVSSGSIYFNTGALLRLQDEAQLASILGHEGTHYTGDHMFRGTVNAKRTAASSIAVGVFVPVVGLLGITSMLGYSRDLEREADRGGFDRMLRAGYDPRAAAEAFRRIDGELVALKQRDRVFWTDHPSVQERIRSFEELSARYSGDGIRSGDLYLARTAAARQLALQILHRQQDSATLVYLLADQKLVDTLPPSAYYYLAEGYRLRNQPDDSAKALAAYQRALELVPEFAPTYEALGMRYLRDGQRSEALRMFERFVALEPDAARTAYARQYIAQLQQPPPSPPPPSPSPQGKP